MTRSPTTIKTELFAKRRELKGAKTKDHAALRDLEDAKRRKLFVSIIVDRESKYLNTQRQVGNIEAEIHNLETELLGDWAPKARRNG